MRRFRGLIALVISIIFGLIAAKAVYWYLNRPEPEQKPAQSAVAQPPKPRSLSEKVPEGMRVVSISLDEVAGMPEGIKRSDRVDVLATSRISDKKGASVTRIILEGVEVYDNGSEEEQSSRKLGQRQKDRAVSLLVRPDQAAALIAASESSRLHLMARNHEDDDQGGTHTTAYSYDTGVERGDDGAQGVEFPPRPGMRAITLLARDTDGVLGVLRPGDRVDVIVTCPFSRFAAGGAAEPGAEGKVTEYAMVSKTLLQNVEILATERVLDLPVGKEVPAKRVTLLVTPAQAERLAVVSDATKKSIVRLVSRHPNDLEHVSTQGENLVDILAEKKEYLRVDVFKGGSRQHKIFFR
jgi:Flp pilus assembly protein CpaB